MAQPLPAKYPETEALKLVVGDTRELEIEFPATYDVDFTTGYTFLSQVRASRLRTSTLLATWTVTAPSARVLHLILPAAQADLLTGTEAWWDVQTTKTAGTVVRTWIARNVTIVGDVSDV